MQHTIAIYTDAHGAICIFRQEAARHVGAGMLRVSDWVTVEFPSIKADDIAAEIRTLDDKVGSSPPARRARSRPCRSGARNCPR